MTARIEISTIVPDSRALVRQKKFHALGLKRIEETRIIDVYTIDKAFSQTDLQKIAEALTNPVIQKFVIRHSKRSEESHSKNKEITIDRKRSFVNTQDDNKFSWAIEIGFLPGVTDNVSHTAKEIIEDLLKVEFLNGENVYTSQITLLDGVDSQKETDAIASELHNPLIQRSTVKSFAEYTKNGGMDIVAPKVHLGDMQNVVAVDINALDDEYMAVLGKQGISYPNGLKKGPLALDVTFLKEIQKYFKKLGRHPTDIELESIAQTWSEHCKHTIFSDPIDEIKDGLYKHYIKRATELIRKKKGKRDICVSVFTDNSGAIIFDDTYLVTHKVETHNSPSALDPFGGSITGIVGVNRDTIGFGMGAKPIANMYGFCLANPDKDVPLFKGKNNTQKMLSSRRIMEGVIAGVNAGGNQSGIPTPQGFVYFDERYRAKPLVFVGTVGLIPKKLSATQLSYVKKARPGDYIVVAGGRVGKDGIHGATFSSEAMDSGSPATAVQIGDPITQKKLSDAVVKEARDMLLYNSITDNGAGGLSCSIAEMASESGGCLVDLEKAPLKYPGLDAWEIWVSESQERMTLAVPKEKWEKFSRLMESRGVEATVIGEFTHSGKCIVKYHNKTIMDVDMDFLHDGLPQRPMTTKNPNTKIQETNVVEPKDYVNVFQEMVSRQNIGSYEFISGQYDHIVQSSLVMGPLIGRGKVNGDTSIIRPVLSSHKGVVLSQGLYPTYSEVDSYAMAAASIDTAVRNAVAAGASLESLALLDNFCWCSATDPERLYQLKEAAKACYDTAIAYETPFISGKDSMFNDFKGFDKNGNPVKISIPPTLLISSIGVMQNGEKAMSLDFKFSGDLLYVLGETSNELTGSEYYSMLSEKDNKQYFGKNIPKVNTKKNKALYASLSRAIEKELVASSISIGRGGLGVALAKSAIAGLLGFDISLKNIPGNMTRDDFALFSESQGRILVSVALQNKESFEKEMKGNNFAYIGQVTSDGKMSMKGLKGKEIIATGIDDLVQSYRKPFKDW